MIRNGTWCSLAVLATLALPGSVFAADPSPQQLELARKVLTASGNDARIAAINSGLDMQDVLTKALQAHVKGVDPSWQPIIAEVVQSEMKAQADQLAAENIKIYASDFSAAELNDMLTFYASPGGRALVAKTPAIVQEKMAWGRQQGQASFERMIEAVCAKKTCSER